MNLLLKGGAELQRCLYAFAVRSLLPGVLRVRVSAAVSSTSKQPITASIPLPIRMPCCPGLPNSWRPRLASLPPATCSRDPPRPIPTTISPSLCRAAPRRPIFDLKFPLIAARLADLAPLWEME